MVVISIHILFNWYPKAFRNDTVKVRNLHAQDSFRVARKQVSTESKGSSKKLPVFTPGANGRIKENGGSQNHVIPMPGINDASTDRVVDYVESELQGRQHQQQQPPSGFTSNMLPRNSSHKTYPEIVANTTEAESESKADSQQQPSRVPCTNAGYEMKQDDSDTLLSPLAGLMANVASS